MSDTTLLGLPLLEAAQAQKHVTVNESLLALDALVQLAVKDRDLTAPPGSPADGDRYIPAASSTGAWAGKDGEIAVWQDGAWAFHMPREGWRAWIDDENKLLVHDGAGWTVEVTGGGGGGGGGGGTHAVCEGRLTLESGVPVSTSDQTAKTTVYFAPYNGNNIGLYDGAAWTLVAFSEVSLSLSGFSANTNYDVFGYDNSGSLALEALAWTNDTTRATALALQDGVWVKSGAATRRYLGTLRITGTTGQTQLKFGGFASGGSEAWFGIWNNHNRVVAPFQLGDTDNSWTYNSTSYRASNNSAQMRVSMVRGLDEDGISAGFNTMATHGSGNAAVNAIGLDSTTAAIAGTKVSFYIASTNVNHIPMYAGLPGLGFHFLSALEATNNGTVNATFYGDANQPSYISNTLRGTLWY